MGNCVACACWSLRHQVGAPGGGDAMARSGFGRCAHQPPYHYFAGHSTCEKFTPAGAGVEDKRVQWLEKQHDILVNLVRKR